MNKYFRLLILLVGCYASSSPDLFCQRSAPVNVILSPEIGDRYAERTIYAAVRAKINGNSALYHQVERGDYEAILKERKLASMRKDDPYVATILKGAAVDIRFTIEAYTELWDSVRVNEVVYGRDYDYSLTIKCVFNLQAVDVATSELLDSKQFTVTGSPVRIQKSFVELQKHLMRTNALGYVRRGVGKATGLFLLQAINPTVPVFKFYGDKPGAKFVMAGGSGVYPRGMKFRLIRESTVTVNGTAVLRQETVGEGSVQKNHKEYTACVITSIKKGVASADMAQYVIPSPKNEVPTEWNEKPTPPKN